MQSAASVASRWRESQCHDIDGTSEAQERLQKMHPKFMDDGLTKAYALYWASATRLQVPVFGHFHGISFTGQQGVHSCR